jgi:hypothetical protein
MISCGCSPPAPWRSPGEADAVALKVALGVPNPPEQAARLVPAAAPKTITAAVVAHPRQAPRPALAITPGQCDHLTLWSSIPPLRFPRARAPPDAPGAVRLLRTGNTRRIMPFLPTRKVINGRPQHNCQEAPTLAVSTLKIVISESPAKVTQPVHTRRYTPGGCRSSRPRNYTPRYSDAQPISVHTEVVAGVYCPQASPAAR